MARYVDGRWTAPGRLVSIAGAGPSVAPVAVDVVWVRFGAMRVVLLVAVLGTRPTALVAQSVDCATSLQTLSTQLNERCCNGGGHRRTQSGACAFTECSEECADLLVPLFRDCRELVVSAGNACWTCWPLCP